ncbi:MAG: DNA repair protein RecO [Candidatus Brocadiae bacterium]|nr:DNA repair protein RecO [Candidatus Brocadiia bacterium]
MAKYHHTEGICLRRVQYSNTSQVASFLTPDAGRLSVMAKGVTRAPKKGVRTGFDLLARYELVYTRRRSGSLQNLTDRWMRESFRDMRCALQRILCGYYAAELMLNFTVEDDPCPALYELLLRSLRSLAAGQRLGLTVLLLELGVLREHGSCPTFDACTECERPVPARGAVLFSPAGGGPLCKECEREKAGSFGGRVTTVRADHLRTLAALNAATDAGAALPALPPRKALASSTLLRFHIRDVLGKELRMWKYLQQRELSRSLQRLRRHARIS